MAGKRTGKSRPSRQAGGPPKGKTTKQVVEEFAEPTTDETPADPAELAGYGEVSVADNAQAESTVVEPYISNDVYEEAEAHGAAVLSADEAEVYGDDGPPNDTAQIITQTPSFQTVVNLAERIQALEDIIGALGVKVDEMSDQVAKMTRTFETLVGDEDVPTATPVRDMGSGIRTPE